MMAGARARRGVSAAYATRATALSSCELSAQARHARLAEVKSPTLRALANVGTYPDYGGNVRLYHATS